MRRSRGEIEDLCGTRMLTGMWVPGLPLNISQQVRSERVEWIDLTMYFDVLGLRKQLARSCVTMLSMTSFMSRKVG